MFEFDSPWLFNCQYHHSRCQWMAFSVSLKLQRTNACSPCFMVTVHWYGQTFLSSYWNWQFNGNVSVNSINIILICWTKVCLTLRGWHLTDKTTPCLTTQWQSANQYSLSVETCKLQTTCGSTQLELTVHTCFDIIYSIDQWLNVCICISCQEQYVITPSFVAAPSTLTALQIPQQLANHCKSSRPLRKTVASASKRPTQICNFHIPPTSQRSPWSKLTWINTE